jgi:hypothetical protein
MSIVRTALRSSPRGTTVPPPQSLDDARLHSVLRAIVANTLLPPLPVIREQGPARVRFACSMWR